MFRNTGAPLQGSTAWVAPDGFSYPGGCFTAQSAVFRPEAVDGLSILKAHWRLCWKPNVPNSELANAPQTSVRLISADSGPSSLAVVASLFSGGKTNTPLNESTDITATLQALIASHANPAKLFQLVHQTAGTGAYGPLIYSSSIELVFNV